MLQPRLLNHLRNPLSEVLIGCKCVKGQELLDNYKVKVVDFDNAHAIKKETHEGDGWWVQFSRAI